MASDSRPLSPHLQVYRWQLTSVLSILHRASGVGLALGAVVLVWWLVAAASGEPAYRIAQGFLGSLPGLVLLFLWTLALFYHLCNGIRHLAWDTGAGFDLKTTYATGWIVLVAAVVLTILAWALGISGWAPA